MLSTGKHNEKDIVDFLSQKHDYLLKQDRNKMVNCLANSIHKLKW